MRRSSSVGRFVVLVTRSDGTASPAVARTRRASNGTHHHGNTTQGASVAHHHHARAVRTVVRALYPKGGEVMERCEYCDKRFVSGYTALKDKSTHKASCSKKRFLGGELSVKEVK